MAGQGGCVRDVTMSFLPTEDQRLEKDERRIVSDRQLSVSVDGALNQLDTSTDGYVDYVEFRRNKNFGMKDTKIPR